MWKYLAIFLFTIPANAQNTPVVGIYRDFSGGLNTYNATTSLAPNESPDLMNVVIDEDGLSQRKGYQSCGNTPSGATATNLYEYSKNDGSRNLIVTDNNTIWTTGDCVIFSTIVTGLGAGNFPRFATIVDDLWIVNGTTWPMVWNGSSMFYLDGVSGRPTGPKGKLIAYWKSRVWIGNTTLNPSAVYFSALVDENGLILSPSTSTGAWSNALNLIYFDRDNGSGLNALKVYRDNMFAFKENSTYRVLFESEYTSNGVVVSKSALKIGSKFQESIVEMDDGLLRFIGNDGEYAFDGIQAKRMSTKWTPTFYSIKQPTHSDSYKLWDVVADWSQGSLSGLSATLVSGALSLNKTDKTFIDSFSGSDYTTSPKWEVGVGTTANFSVSGGKLGYIHTNGITEQDGQLVSTVTVVYSTGISGSFYYTYAAYDDKILDYYFAYDSDTQNGYYLRIQHDLQGATPVEYAYIMQKSKGLADIVLSSFSISGLRQSGASVCGTVYRSYMNIKADVTITSYSITGTLTGMGGTSIGKVVSSTATTNTTTPNILKIKPAIFVYSTDYGCGANASSSTIDGISFTYNDGQYVNSGTFTSQITTATGITVWKTFDTDQTLNDQSITYEIKTASTVANMAGTAFSATTPGTLVSTTTNGFVQWRATIATSTTSVTPLLNSGVVSWTTGDATKSALYGIAYKSRYWMAASTTIGNDYNDMTIVESRSPLTSHTRFDLPLSAMTIWNGNLYGAIGNTSKIARLDYGDTDDGAAIRSYYDTPDEIYSNPVTYKTVNKMVADFSSLPANTGLQIGLSPDTGSTWAYRTINTAIKPNLLRNTSVINLNAVTALSFRSRVLNTTPGIGFKIYGLFNFGMMGMFIGN